MTPQPHIDDVGHDPARGHTMEGGNGRTLRQHALVYIGAGRGTFTDSATPSCRVGGGWVFFLAPGVWHCYDAAVDTTWDEFWVSFDGDATRAAYGDLLPEHGSVFDVGQDQRIDDVFTDIIRSCKPGGPNHVLYQNYLLHRLLILIYFKIHDHRIEVAAHEAIVTKALKMMRDHLHASHFDLRAFAEAEDVPYESMRKWFKSVTGRSPHQHFLSVKMRRGKHLLLNTDMTVDEIAASLGFSDAYYFSRLFRKKIGMPPTTFRAYESYLPL
jgi:AraC-like DNA-binding protein